MLFCEKTKVCKKSDACFSRTVSSKGSLVALQSKILFRDIDNMTFDFLFVSLMSIVIDAYKMDLN